MQTYHIILFSIITMLVSCMRKEKIDTIVSADKIYLVDAEFTNQQAMAIDKGKIVAVGTLDEINSKYEAKEFLFFEDKYIFPGFIDPHCHFIGYGQMLQNPWLGGADSWEEVVDRVVNYQKENPSQWVLGRGWNHAEWRDKNFPTKELLDKHFPDKPVFLTRIDGHCAIANSVALKMAKIDSKTRINGGVVEVVNNQPTGLLIDNAMEYVREIIPEYTTQEKVQQILVAQKNCFAVGLTSVTDAGLSYEDIMLYDSLSSGGELKMFINAMIEASEENINKTLAIRDSIGEKLSVHSIKMYADGALGSRGALLLEPYSDDPSTSGLQVNPKEYYTQMCSIAFDNNLQVCTHCIGDKAVSMILDIYSNFLTSGNDLRWRIEHSQVVQESDFDRYGKFNIIPSIQTTHATSDMSWAEQRLGDRVKNAYAYKRLLEQNSWIPNGSDFPIEDINPIYGFYSGVFRKNVKTSQNEGFQVENALSREQALRAMTIWAAKADFKEAVRGSLEAGKVADFVVLDTDLMEADESQITNSKVLKTFVDGIKVFEQQ